MSVGSIGWQQAAMPQNVLPQTVRPQPSAVFGGAEVAMPKYPRNFDSLEISGSYPAQQGFQAMPFVGARPAATGMNGAGALDKTNEIECQTCANRRYQDGSDDASVSFQSPTRINPHTAAATVMSHEREHVVNERTNAEREDREVINQSVSLKYSTCPECGKMYVAGGETRTTTKGKTEQKPELPDFFGAAE